MLHTTNALKTRLTIYNFCHCCLQIACTQKEKKRKGSYCEAVLCLQLVLQFLQLAISLLLFPETRPEICQSLLQAN